MALEIHTANHQFRITGQGISLDWLADTPANRKSALVFLRHLISENGKPSFTHQQLAEIVDSPNRQASSEHIRAFQAVGGDFLTFLTRHKTVVDSVVVTALIEELKIDPLLSCAQLLPRVNARLGRSDLTRRNIFSAMDLVPLTPFRKALKQKVKRGKAHYTESYLLSQMMTRLSSEAEQGVEFADCQPESMSLSDPTAVKKLFDPKSCVKEVKSPLAWISFLMALYYHGLPLSVIGKWCGVHKTTILRWIMGLAMTLWPEVRKWITTSINAKVVFIDEKWIKIKGKWHYWFVVLDQKTELPICATLLPTRSQWACRWIGILLKSIGQLPRVIITDGLESYRYVCCTAKHLNCRFHHQQNVTQWLKKHFATKEERDLRKPLMKKILQTEDKRTVKRRLEKLKEMGDSLGITPWIHKTEQNLEKLLPLIGSRKFPATTNAIERFFRSFNRFYKVRCGFFSMTSALRQLIFFQLMFVFVIQPQAGIAPIEKILPRAREMPFYQLVNNPLQALMGLEFVKLNTKMADFHPTASFASLV